MPATDEAIRAASRAAQERVAEAISIIVGLGADAPSSLREAAAALGTAYTALGWADPSAGYSVPSAESGAQF